MPDYGIRPMGRCVVETCRRWWCLDPALCETGDYKCACGGALINVDMDEHMKTVPAAIEEKPPA
jgi:hypothetical protein